jgi:hypothetical protein
MIKVGLLLALVGLIGLIYHPDEKTGMIIGFGFLILMVIALLIRVESAIKNKFK